MKKSKTKDWKERLKDIFDDEDTILEEGYDNQTGINYVEVNEELITFIEKELEKAKLKAQIKECEFIVKTISRSDNMTREDILIGIPLLVNLYKERLSKLKKQEDEKE